MAYASVINGLCRFMEEYGDHEILKISDDKQLQLLCAVLYNNYRVLNYHLAMVFDISSGQMSEWRRLDQDQLNLDRNRKLSARIRPKLKPLIERATLHQSKSKTEQKSVASTTQSCVLNESKDEKTNPDVEPEKLIESLSSLTLDTNPQSVDQSNDTSASSENENSPLLAAVDPPSCPPVPGDVPSPQSKTVSSKHPTHPST